jgi:hypothetical protein
MMDEFMMDEFMRDEFMRDEYMGHMGMITSDPGFGKMILWMYLWSS